VRLDRGALDHRRRERHEDRGAHGKSFRGDGDTEPVIARRRRDDAERQFLLRKGKQGIQRAAHLERATDLLRLEFEEDLAADLGRERGRVSQRRVDRHAADADGGVADFEWGRKRGLLAHLSKYAPGVAQVHGCHYYSLIGGPARQHQAGPYA